MAQTFSYGNYSHTQRKNARTSGGRSPQDRNRRELSQNFMVDSDAIRRVIDAAMPTGLVLEPGTGGGALTTALAATGAHVVGYEIDPLLAAKLQARNRNSPNIEIIRGDFTRARPPREQFAVVGNIPYTGTADIVNWCLHAPELSSATLVTQLEYARKHTGDYRRWSLRTVTSWPWFTWTLAGHIGRTSFRPVPSVDSAILRITRRKHPLVEDEAGYRRLVELGFRGIGGSLYRSLRPHYRYTETAFAHAGVARDTIVAHVHPDQWVTLHRELTPVS